MISYDKNKVQCIIKQNVLFSGCYLTTLLKPRKKITERSIEFHINQNISRAWWSKKKSVVTRATFNFTTFFVFPKQWPIYFLHTWGSIANTDYYSCVCSNLAASNLNEASILFAEFCVDINHFMTLIVSSSITSRAFSERHDLHVHLFWTMRCNENWQCVTV